MKLIVILFLILEIGLCGKITKIDLVQSRGCEEKVFLIFKLSNEVNANSFIQIR